MLIDLNDVMQRAPAAHAVCTISDGRGTMGSREGTMGAAGGCSVAGSQGAEYKSTADISSMPFPLLWMCLAPVLQETMASFWLNMLTGKAEVWSCLWSWFYLVLLFLIDEGQVYPGSDQHHTRVTLDLQKWQFVFSMLAHQI